MDFIIPVSEGERARGDLNPSTARAVHTAMAAHGVAILRGAFSTDAIDGLREVANHCLRCLVATTCDHVAVQAYRPVGADLSEEIRRQEMERGHYLDSGRSVLGQLFGRLRHSLLLQECQAEPVAGTAVVGPQFHGARPSR